MTKWSGRRDAHHQQLCLACVGDAASLDCYYCSQTLPLQCFSNQYRKPDHAFRRCNECCKKCSLCNRKLPSAKSFATATTLCWPCFKQKQLISCVACGDKKGQDAFEANILRHSQQDHRKAVCIQCQGLGFSPQDTAKYRCNGRGGHDCGHLAFERVMLKHYKQRPAMKLMCQQCSEDCRSCIGCSRILHRDAFASRMWTHATADERSLVCQNCQQNGLWLHDQQYYFCGGRGNKYGHMNFGRETLKDHRRRPTALSCKRCNAAAEEEVKLENARARALVAQLRRTEAWRCTCRKIPRGQRAHAALNNNVHAERCQLFQAGERRWDGKNVGIELDDLRFLSPRGIY